MKEHVLRGITLILVFFSYFAWRIDMVGFDLIVYPFVLVGAIVLALVIRGFCMEPKDDKKRNQDRVVFIMILALFLIAVLIRIIFLS